MDWAIKNDRQLCYIIRLQCRYQATIQIPPHFELLVVEDISLQYMKADPKGTVLLFHSRGAPSVVIPAMS